MWRRYPGVLERRAYHGREGLEAARRDVKENQRWKRRVQLPRNRLGKLFEGQWWYEAVDDVEHPPAVGQRSAPSGMGTGGRSARPVLRKVDVWHLEQRRRRRRERSEVEEGGEEFLFSLPLKPLPPSRPFITAAPRAAPRRARPGISAGYRERPPPPFFPLPVSGPASPSVSK